MPGSHVSRQGPRTSYTPHGPAPITRCLPAGAASSCSSTARAIAAAVTRAVSSTTPAATGSSTGPGRALVSASAKPAAHLEPREPQPARDRVLVLAERDVTLALFAVLRHQLAARKAEVAARRDRKRHDRHHSISCRRERDSTAFTNRPSQ